MAHRRRHRRHLRTEAEETSTPDWIWHYWHYATDMEPSIPISPEALREYCELQGEPRGIEPRAVAARLMDDEAQWRDFLAWLRDRPVGTYGDEMSCEHRTAAPTRPVAASPESPLP